MRRWHRRCSGSAATAAPPARPAVANSRWPGRWLVPDILDVRRQCHRAALDQRGAVDVDVVERELGADAGVIDRLGFVAAHMSPRSCPNGRGFFKPRVLADKG